MGVAKNRLRNHFEAISCYANGAGRELRILGRPMENFPQWNAWQFISRCACTDYVIL